MTRLSCLAVLGLVGLLLVPPASVPADDPEFNGRKMSAWLSMLQEDKLPRKRRAAVVALSQIVATSSLTVQDQDTIYTLIGKVMRNDTSEGVREQAANVLGQLKPDSVNAVKAAEDMVEALRAEKDLAVRRELIAGVIRFGKLAKDAVRPLTLLLKDADPATRALAADALGRFSGDAKDAIGDLLPLLKDADKSVNLAAVFAIGRVQPDDTAPAAAALIEVFKTASEMDMRREALVALGLLADHSADTLKTLTAVLADEKEAPELRRTAIVALSRFGPAVRPAEADLKAAMTKDKDKLVRLNAVRALVYGYGDQKKDLIPFLVDRLKPEAESDFEVRVAVAEELGGMGADGKPAVPALRSAQRDPQIKVRDAATAAIKAIEKPPAPPKDAP
jgi:HEAT repeat protein